MKRVETLRQRDDKLIHDQLLTALHDLGKAETHLEEENERHYVQRALAEVRSAQYLIRTAAIFLKIRDLP